MFGIWVGGFFQSGNPSAKLVCLAGRSIAGLPVSAGQLSLAQRKLSMD